MATRSDLYRKLPAVDELLRTPEVAALVTREGHVAVAEAARAVLARMREEIAAGVLNPDRLEIAISGLPAAIEHQFQQSLAYSLRSVINATGVILHTNLGRAPLCATAFDHVRDVALGYSNLEFDMAAGERGKRDVHVDRLFRRLLSEDTADVGAGLRPALAQPDAQMVRVSSPNETSLRSVGASLRPALAY